METAFYKLIANDKKGFRPNSVYILMKENKELQWKRTSTINKLKYVKAPGSDNIPVELLKCGRETLHKQLHKLVTRIWKEERIPTKWRDSKIIPIYKKGDKTKCYNYSGIPIINTAYQILSNVLPNK